MFILSNIMLVLAGFRLFSGILRFAFQSLALLCTFVRKSCGIDGVCTAVLFAYEENYNC